MCWALHRRCSAIVVVAVWASCLGDVVLVLCMLGSDNFCHILSFFEEKEGIHPFTRLFQARVVPTPKKPSTRDMSQN
jgi:hypothetical protein